MAVCIFDIEADNLLTTATKVWCIVAKIDNQYHIFNSDSKGFYQYPVDKACTVYFCKQDYLTFLNQHTLVGHNIISYDLPLLKKLHGYSYSIDPSKLVDTHILSRLYNPDSATHSLESYGELLKFPKGDHKDWSCMSQEMLDYCIRDVDLTEAVYNLLQKENNDWDWSEAIKLEYNIWHIQQKQEQHGVLLDQEAANNLLEKIQEELSELEDKLVKEMPPVYKNDGELKKIFLKNGEYTSFVKEWLNEPSE